MTTLSEQQKRSLTPNEQATLDAIQGKRVSDASPEDVIKILRYISTMSGADLPEDSESIRFLADHLLTWSKGLTLPEMKVAVQMNAGGEWEKVPHYGKLSGDFISGIIGKYREFRQKTIQHYKALLPLPEEKKVSNEELYNSLIALHKKLGEFPYTFPYGRVYKHLEAEINLSDDQKKRIFAEEKAKFTHRATKDEILVKVYERIVKGYLVKTVESTKS